MEKEKTCEAKYGNKQCKNKIVSSVIANGRIFNLCKNCRKLTRKQNKLNNNY